MTLYVALLGAYAADKEIRRWLGVPEPPRKGTIFVYLWLLLFLTFSLIHTFQPDLAMPSLESYGVNVYQTAQQAGLAYINGQDTVTYFGMVLWGDA